MRSNFISVLNLSRQVSLLLVLVITGSYNCNLFSQNVKTKPSRQSSIEAFSDGKYELAYDQFSELLLLYPKDPLYKYYSGVCLVKLNREPDKASTLLSEALQGAAVLRTLPSDALFYLGRAQQMSGKFNEAIDSYKKYENQSGRKAAKESGIPELIQQCINKQGEVVPKEADIKENVEREKQISTSVKPEQAAKIINQQPVDKGIISKPALPPDFEKLLDEALDLQVKADSLSEDAAKQKQALGGVPDIQKESAKKRISETELLAASYQKQADEKFNMAEGLKPGSQVKSKIDPVEMQNTEKKEEAKVADTLIKEKYKPASPNLVFSDFKVLDKPASGVKDKIIIDPEVPEGLVYRIQVAVFRNPVEPSYFKGITPVYGLRLSGNGLTNYYAGIFRRSSDAAKALIAVKAKGFKDAFTVAFFGKKPVSAERAAVLEKEWGKRPLTAEIKTTRETMKDTLAPALVFRIEVTRSAKPLKDDVTEGLKTIAGNRGMEIITTDDGKFVYLIGKFITFESAAEYNDLLIRNGYREAKVVAWLGRNEIPVETARQLFEKLK